MSIIDVVNNFCNSEGELGNRVRLAVSYRDALARGDNYPHIKRCRVHWTHV